MNTIQQLKESVKFYLNFNESDSGYKDVLELLDLNFQELEGQKFGVVLSKDVINPLAKKLTDLKANLSNTGRSISKRKQRKILTHRCNNLTELLKEIFTNYNIYLKNNPFFQDYVNELNNKYSQNIEEILTGEKHEDSERSFIYPIYFSNTKMQTLSDKIIEYIKLLNSDKEAYEFAKDKTISLFSKIREAIEKVQKVKVKTEMHYSKIESKLKKVDTKDAYKDSETGVVYNLQEYYRELLTDYALEINNINNHEVILNKLLAHLNNEYPYLSKEESVILNQITVFGDSNYEKVKRLADGLKSLAFVSNQTDYNDLFKVFMLNKNQVAKPINFTNGTLNDFGYLMLKLRPFFIDTISVKSEYGKWWSQNFTFKTKEKNKKEVSNMISAIERGERFSEKRMSINELVENLNPIPQ